MTQYIYMSKAWPRFSWDPDAIVKPLAELRNKQGVLMGKTGAIGFQLQVEAYLKTLSQDVIKSSEIESEFLDHQQVRSSIARKLNINIGGLVNSSRDVDGVVEMMVDATQNWDQALTADRLFAWHSALFPSGRTGLHKIIVGNWRDDSTGPMQVVSGPMGMETVHFQAPQAAKIPDEIEAFLKWINTPNQNDDVINAAISHLWFVTIHPFEDGNGRIARAITDMMLCRSEHNAQRFYSMSAQIMAQRKAYYDILKSTQQDSLDITEWILWFLDCLSSSITSSAVIVEKTISKHNFWSKHKAVPFNERQIKIIELLFGDFFGKLSTSKWAKINKCSPDTALRDIQDLMTKGILSKSASGGRSTNYNLVLD